MALSFATNHGLIARGDAVSALSTGAVGRLVEINFVTEWGMVDWGDVRSWLPLKELCPRDVHNALSSGAAKQHQGAK